MANRKEMESKADCETSRGMVSQLKVQYQAQEVQLRDLVKKQSDQKREWETTVKEQTRRCREAEESRLRMEYKVEDSRKEGENKNNRIEKLLKKIQMPIVKEIEKVVHVDKVVEKVVYIDRPVVEVIHAPPVIKRVEVPVVVEQTPVVNEVIRSTVYQ